MDAKDTLVMSSTTDAAEQSDMALETERSCPHGHSAFSRASCRHAGGSARMSSRVERREGNGR
jgi:hypothetical protein